MTPRRRFRAASALGLSLVLAAVACVPQLGERRQAAPTPTPDPNARPGGRIVAAVAEPASIDPTTAHDPAELLVASTMCDTLVALDPVTGEPRPAIARSWTISNRGRTLLVRLRKGVRFHDGREVVAEDVAFTLSRLASADYASASAGLVEPVVGYEYVSGDADTDDERLRRRLLGVRIVDPHNVEITLREPLADWYLALTHPATAPVSRAAVEAGEEAFARRPVCAGPYRLARDWTPGSPIALERFDEYYGGNEAFSRGGRGYADAIELRPHREAPLQVKSYLSNEVDVAHAPEDQAASLQRTLGADVVAAETAQVEYVGLPTNTPPFDRREVRVALSVALDRAALVREIWQSGRSPATGVVAASVPGAQACPEQVPPRRGDARALLDDAGVSLDGTTVKLYFNDEHRNRALVTAVAKAWQAETGLKAVPTPVAWGKLLELGTRPRGFEAAFRFGWAPDYPSLERVIAPLFDADGIGRDNLSLFGSRELAAALRDARRAAADTDRRAAYARANAIVCREMPMIPVAIARRWLLVRQERLASAVKAAADRVTAQPLLRELYVRAG